MKLNCVCTAVGLVPAYDDDYEEKHRLKIGKTYEVDVKEARNIRFHRLFFALINCSWEFLGEFRQEFFHNDRNVYRKAVTIAAGYSELFYSPTRGEWLEQAKSIAFGKMDETEFSTLYERVKDVIYKMYIPDNLKEEFETNLKYF
jgi:hypothetical protein